MQRLFRAHSKNSLQNGIHNELLTRIRHPHIYPVEPEQRNTFVFILFFSFFHHIYFMMCYYCVFLFLVFIFTSAPLCSVLVLHVCWLCSNENYLLTYLLTYLSVLRCNYGYCLSR